MGMRVCTICGKRFGTPAEGAEVEIRRCEEHGKVMSTAERDGMGMTAGNVAREERKKLMRMGAM